MVPCGHLGFCQKLYFHQKYSQKSRCLSKCQICWRYLKCIHACKILLKYLNLFTKGFSNCSQLPSWILTEVILDPKIFPLNQYLSTYRIWWRYLKLWPTYCIWRLSRWQLLPSWISWKVISDSVGTTYGTVCSKNMGKISRSVLVVLRKMGFKK